ncbi:MAG: DUF4157 domain-containing protein, partial [Bacteroidia bacterium]|nr:DUF4157 domain-containing protein [Bacteroidia bacterium]
QRKCKACADEMETNVQRKEQNQTSLEATSSISQVLQSSGETLPDDSRSFMENRFGYDFSKVKVHTDSVAAKSAQSINALAYTSGNNIVFNEGQYSPHTEEGKKLLAHELTHTLQQNENHVIQKQEKPVAHTSPKTKTTTYQFLGNWYEQKHFDFFANAAYDTMAACLNEKFSMAGALFVIALVTTESGWGGGNGGKAYHNLFSIMGGDKGNIGTAHGTLKKFSTYEAGFSEGFIKKIVDGVDATGKAKFPNIRPVLSKPDFTMDEVNEAFGQAANYNPGKRYSYEADGRLTWAEKYFKDVNNTTVPFMRNELRNRLDSTQQLNRMIPAEDQVQMLPE